MSAMTRSLVVSLAVTFLATPANAAALYCVGSVKHLHSRSGGELLFKAGYRGDSVAVCNLQAAWNGITPDQCKSWYSMLLAAQLADSPVTVHYQNNEGYASCAVVPTYSAAPAPGYVLLGDAFNLIDLFDAAPSLIVRITSSRLKLAAFWRCGYSLKVIRNLPT